MSLIHNHNRVIVHTFLHILADVGASKTIVADKVEPLLQNILDLRTNVLLVIRRQRLKVRRLARRGDIDLLMGAHELIGNT